jgi:hypothetical protein
MGSGTAQSRAASKHDESRCERLVSDISRLSEGVRTTFGGRRDTVFGNLSDEV